MKPTIVNTSDLAAVSPYMCDVVLAEGLKAVCLLPLVNRGRALGMLGIGRIGESAFTPSDVEFLTRVSGQIAIALENALAYQEISDLKDRLAEEKLYLEEEIRSEMNFENIIGTSPALKHVLELVETVATSDSTVLLLGGDRNRKGVNRSRHSRPQPAERSHVCQAELRRHSDRSAGERTVWK